ncbi:MAG: GPH family glycoside/pentoside/hexuronide:cation symporter [Gammaproteobacteria bacterium]|jgi:GPH family glycoside/pentoside/hexuronide:cation symporter
MSYTRPEKNPVYWFYGSASVAFGIKNNAFSYLLLIYSTQVLGIPGYLAAAALAIAMAWDAVSDLFLGHWSDKTDSRLGRRHPFMYAGFIMLPLSFYALFNPVIELTEANRWGYLLVTAILIRTAVTLVEVPSVALLPDLVKDYDERNKWLALRHAFGWYGGNGIHVVNMGIWVGAYGVAVQTGYSTYGIVGAFIIAASILISSLGTQKVAASMPPPSEPFRFREIWYEIKQISQSVKNSNFFWLFLYSLFVGAASGLSTALYLYNVTYFFTFTGPQIAVTGIFVFASPAIAYFLAPALGRAFGKKRAAVYALMVAILLYPMPYLLTLTGFWPEAGSWNSLIIYSFFVMSEVVGFIVGGVMLDSMMADVVEDSEVQTSRRSEGLFYAARSFASKAVSALGIILAGSIVTLVGMDGIKGVEDMTDVMREDLASFFLPAYCGLYFLAIFLISKYKIDRETHQTNLEALARKA